MVAESPDLALEARVDGGRDVYRFHTAAGVCSPDTIRPGERLLLDVLWEYDLGRLLVLQANYGVLGTILDARATRTTLVESSARALGLCEQNLATNGVDAATTLAATVPRRARAFDTVAYAPKPYTATAIAKQRLADALASLVPGGRLALAASTHTGRNRYEQCLETLAADVERVKTHDGYAVLIATAPPTVDAPRFVTPRTIRTTVDSVTLTLRTVPGLFSATRLDDGTRLLIDTATVSDGDRVLDLCCGAGPLGAWAGRRANCEVWLTDDDRVATRCAEQTLDASGVDSAVVTGDCTDHVSHRTFDTILCNPPTHAGGGVLDDLFAGAHDVLARDGDLFLVHHRSLDLTPHLRRFESVEHAAVGEEHVVLHATG